MKESTFCLIMAVLLVTLSYFDSNSARAFFGHVMGFGFVLTGTICMAIEKNGRER